MRMRFRDLGYSLGELPPGPLNALTDVAGVLVGHCTLISGTGSLQPGLGPVRTGVTVILPHAGDLYGAKTPAAVYTINGFGKPAGFEQVRELGLIEAPIGLTNTLNVGIVLDALVQYSLRQNPQIGILPESGSVNVVVGETNDGYLNDIQGRHVKAEHVFMALEAAASGRLQEGAVGAGTGTLCFGWKGGIGSASRRLPLESGGFTLGALVQSNFGQSRDLVISGLPVGRWLPSPQAAPPAGAGSVMIVLATDAPLDARQLGRLCKRAAAGLARCGAQFSHGSGDFVIAFSAARRIFDQTTPHMAAQKCGIDDPAIMNDLFRAVIESVEEAVINSLLCADTVEGRDHHLGPALPIDALCELLIGRL